MHRPQAHVCLEAITLAVFNNKLRETILWLTPCLSVNSLAASFSMSPFESILLRRSKSNFYDKQTASDCFGLSHMPCTFLAYLISQLPYLVFTLQPNGIWQGKKRFDFGWFRALQECSCAHMSSRLAGRKILSSHVHFNWEYARTRHSVHSYNIGSKWIALQMYFSINTIPHKQKGNFRNIILCWIFCWAFLLQSQQVESET